MRTILRYALALLAIAFPAGGSSAQSVWEYEDGPCGGTFRWIVPHNGGLAAAPYYRSYVLIGNADGSAWRQADLPDAAAQPFSLFSAGGRLFAGGFGRVYRSDDDGASWKETEIPALQSAQITRLTGSADTLFGCGGGMLLRSANHGVTWDTVGVGGCRDVLMTDGGHVVVAQDSLILESTDGGGSWFSRDGSPSDITKLHAAAGILYAARTVSNVRPLAPVLFRLTDPTIGTWEASALLEPFVTSLTERNGVLYAGSDVDPGPQLLRSSDGGLQWDVIDETRLPFPRPRAVSALHGATGGLLAGVTNLGIWYLEENAGSWRNVTDGFFPVGVARVGFVGDRVIAYSMKENFVAFRDGRSGAWQLLPYLEDARPGDMLVRGGRVTLGTSSGVRSTTDFGTQWEYGVIGDGTRRVQALGWGAGRMIAGVENGVSAWSGDEGAHWIPDTTAGIQTWYTFAEGSQDTLFAATSPLGLLVSPDTGSGWTPLPLPAMSGAIFDVVVHDAVVYVASNRGITAWSAAGGGMPLMYDRPAYRLCATPRGLVAATQDDGIILFPGYGVRWGSVNQGLPEAHFATPDVCRIAFAFAHGRLWFGNCGMPGLWSIDLLGAVPVPAVPAPQTHGILSISPFPLSTRGMVALRVREGEMLRLVLHDLLGRRIRLLHEGIAERTMMHLPLDVSSLPAGMYMLTFECGQGREARMLTVAR